MNQASLEDAVTKGQLLAHIQTSPKCTILRINTLFPTSEVKDLIEKELQQVILSTK